MMKKEKYSLPVLMKKITQTFYILLTFLSITIVVLIAVSINYHLIKYRAKRKHLLPFHEANLTCYFFSDVINIKNFDPILKQMKSHIKIFLFVTLDMWQSKFKTRKN